MTTVPWRRARGAASRGTVAAASRSGRSARAAREVLARVVDHAVRTDRRTMSTFRVLVTPVTSAPSALAIWTAKVPTPPPAPLISTRWPPRARPCREGPEGGLSRDGHRGGLLEREAVRHRHHAATADVFGECAGARAEHAVAGLEVRHVLADRLDDAGDVEAQDVVFGRRKPSSRRAR